MAATQELALFTPLAEFLARVADRMEPERCAAAGALLLDRMAEARDNDAPRPVTDALGALAANLPCADKANLLKHPACLGPARQAILRPGDARAARRFESLWDFVDWAGQQEPGVDLASPYRRTP
jgi:hypothetical protein